MVEDHVIDVTLAGGKTWRMRFTTKHTRSAPNKEKRRTRTKTQPGTSSRIWKGTVAGGPLRVSSEIASQPLSECSGFQRKEIWIRTVSLGWRAIEGPPLSVRAIGVEAGDTDLLSGSRALV